MRLLLDTQVFLWFLDDDSRIPRAARAAIAADENVVLVSAVVVWEIAIKAALGRLRIAAADVARLPALIDEAGFDELPVRARHASRVHELPAHHRDPFDRLLVAQALVEGLTLVSADPALRPYGVPVL